MQKNIIATILGIVAALSALGYHMNGDMNTTTYSTELTKYQAWKQWLQQYGKQYQFQEMPLKYSVFSANYDLIQSHNSQESSYKLGLNAYADLTSQEFAAYRMNIPYQADNQEPTILDHHHDFPSSLNWHSKGAVGPVNNQGQCGSCWAFSAVESIEGLYQIKHGKFDQFSVQQVVDCSEYTGAEGCNGGTLKWAYEYVEKYGIQSRSSYPYKAVTGKCKYDSSQVDYKISGYKNIQQDAPQQMKAALQNQPVSVCIEADTSQFQLYSSGVFDYKGCGTQLDHCVLLAGYGSQGRTDYWIVQNSWGTSWGQQGYIWIEIQDGKGICGINTNAAYPTA